MVGWHIGTLAVIGLVSMWTTPDRRVCICVARALGSAAWQASYYNVSASGAGPSEAPAIGKGTFVGVLVACLVILGVSALLVVLYACLCMCAMSVVYGGILVVILLCPVLRLA